MRIITLKPESVVGGTPSAMFDGDVNTQYTEADGIVSSFSASGVNSCVVLNNEAESLNFVANGDSQIVSLERENGRIGKDLVFYFDDFAGLFPLSATFSYSGGTAKCGEIIPGNAVEYASTLYGAELGINDFTIIDADSFGHTYLSPGNWTKRVIATLTVPNILIDLLSRYIIDNRGMATVFDYNEYAYALNGATGHNSDSGLRAFVVYGFTVDFYITHRGSTCSIANHEVQGLR